VKILILEDMEHARANIHEFLTLIGHESIPLDTSIDLAATLDRVRPEAILLFFRTPLQAEFNWNLLAGCRSYPTIVVGSDGPQERDGALARGARVYLLKPFRLQTLEAAIASLEGLD